MRLDLDHPWPALLVMFLAAGLAWRLFNRWADWFEALIVGLLAACLLFLFVELLHDYAHPCTRTRREWVRREAYTTFAMIGKVMIPFYHPATEGWEDVCVARRGCAREDFR